MIDVTPPPPGVIAGHRCQVAQTPPMTTLATNGVYRRWRRGSAKPRQPTSSPKDPATSAPTRNARSAALGTASQAVGGPPPAPTWMPTATRKSTAGTTNTATYHTADTRHWSTGRRRARTPPLPGNNETRIAASVGAYPVRMMPTPATTGISLENVTFVRSIPAMRTGSAATNVMAKTRAAHTTTARKEVIT